MDRPLAILRYNRDVSVTGDTLAEHNQSISDWGACWWAWFPARADNVPETVREIRSRFANKSMFPVALWDRSHGQIAVAMCNKVAIQSGDEPREAPDPQFVPQDGEHLPGKWPVWFQLVSIQTMNQVDFVNTYNLFLDVGATSTILWPRKRGPVNGGQSAPPITWATEKGSFLHLSDLHFGKGHRWATSHKNREGLTTFQALQSSIESNPCADAGDIGGVVVSGDISSLGPDHDAYSEASNFFHELRDWLDLETEAFIIVPGNHDISRLSKEESLEGDVQLRAQHDRTRAGEVLYREFLNSFYGRPNVPMVRWHQLNFLKSDVRLNLLALNSARLTSIDDREYGYTGRAHQAYMHPMLVDKTERDQRGLATLGCAVLHHHLISAYAEEIPERAVGQDWVDPVSSTLDAVRILQELSAFRFQLVLHGHQHVPSWAQVSKDLGWYIDIDGGGSIGASGDWLHPDYNFNYWSLYKFRDREMTRMVVPFNSALTARDPILVQTREVR